MVHVTFRTRTSTHNSRTETMSRTSTPLKEEEAQETKGRCKIFMVLAMVTSLLRLVSGFSILHCVEWGCLLDTSLSQPLFLVLCHWLPLPSLLCYLHFPLFAVVSSFSTERDLVSSWATTSGLSTAACVRLTYRCTLLTKDSVGQTW